MWARGWEEVCAAPAPLLGRGLASSMPPHGEVGGGSSFSSVIPVLVTGIQPPRVGAVNESIGALKQSLAPKDLGALDSCDGHRNCLSNLCFTAGEAGIEPRDGHPGARATKRPYRNR
ncbi:hypothetical protein Rleg4DRAFT_2038, partial [Rhizobium leguminosarum bv. trifolii WSM2297]